MGPGAKTIKKNTNSTQNKSETHHAKQYEVTSFLSTDCELSTETCSKNVYSLGPKCLENGTNSRRSAEVWKIHWGSNVRKWISETVYYFLRHYPPSENVVWNMRKSLERASISFIPGYAYYFVHQLAPLSYWFIFCETWWWFVGSLLISYDRKFMRWPQTLSSNCVSIHYLGQKSTQFPEC